MSTETRRPLLVSAAPAVREAVTRVAAAAGADPLVLAPAELARAAWGEAPLVLLGADALEAARDAGLARRPGVLVVAAENDPALFRRALEVGAEEVIELGPGDAALAERLADAVEGDRAPGTVIGVVGGRGGAGATTLACALAVTAAAEGASAVLVDADAYGGGADLVLGAEQAPGVRWADLAGTVGRISSRALADALPVAHGVRVLSWNRGEHVDVTGPTVAAVLRACARTSDVVVVDLPRHIDAAARAAIVHVDVVLVVVPADVRGVAAAARVASVVAAGVTDVRIVVRRGDRRTLPAQSVAAVLGLPLAAVVGEEPDVAALADRGQPPAVRGRGPLGGLAGDLLALLVPHRAVA